MGESGERKNMTYQPLKSGRKMVRFGEVVGNANLVERDPVAAGIGRVVGLKHFEPGNLHVRRWDSAEGGASFNRKFTPGQTLFGKRRAYQRKVAYAEFGGVCSGDILTLESKDSTVLLPRLLPFICQSDAFFEHALGTSVGSLSPRTNWKALQDFEFPLPPLGEQKRIAAILWAADEVVERNKHLKDALRALYLKTVERFCFDKRHREARVDEVSIINGRTLSSDTDKAYRFKYLDISSVLAPNKIGELTEYVFADAPGRARRVVSDMDILLSTVRPNLQSFVRARKINFNLIASTGFAVLSPKNHAAGSLMFHAFFSKRFYRYCEARVTGTTYPAISPADIGKFKINLPADSGKVATFAGILDSIDCAILKADSGIQYSRSLKKALMEHLIGQRSAHV